MKEKPSKVNRVVIRVATFGATKQQDDWLKNKSATTGDSQASILRGLIQKEIDNGSQSTEKHYIRTEDAHVIIRARSMAIEIAKQKGERLADTWINALQDYKCKDQSSGWISVTKSLPEGHVYVALMNKHGDDQPPTIGWATYWQPKNEFAGFEVQDDYESDYGKEFTHWMEL